MEADQRHKFENKILYTLGQMPSTHYTAFYAQFQTLLVSAVLTLNGPNK